MNLEELRKQIDDLDQRLIDLIAERMKIVRQIGEEKQVAGNAIEDRAREKTVIERVRRLAEARQLNPAEVEKIFQRIFYVSKETQGATVAFQGETGSFAEEAGASFFGPAARLKGYDSLEDVFQTVEKDENQFAIVPVENSLEGSITRTYDLLLDSRLNVSGEIQLRVVQCLIGLPAARLELIKEVCSHPQALGQCKTFLRRMGWKQNATSNTAGSVKLIKELSEVKNAAIASERAAQIYGMKVLAQGIEDNPNNFTRFFILSRQEAPPTGNDKTSLVFTVKHTPGALYDALKALAEKKTNMTRIESRPTRQKAWEYNFYVDLEGHRNDQSVKDALAELEKHAIFVRILGSYAKSN